MSGLSSSSQQSPPVAATSGGELSASDARSVGRVAEIGVVPARRGAGLGLALLHDGFRELTGRGATRIVLDVDAENTTNALRLYQSAGMTPRPAFTIWEKRPASHVHTDREI